MTALKLLLAVALGIAVLVSGATASAQSDLVVFEEAESRDDTCDLLLNDGGPYEVSIAGSIAVVYENGSVVAVPQGCLLYTSPSPRDQRGSRMPSSA